MIFIDLFCSEITLFHVLKILKIKSIFYFLKNYIYPTNSRLFVTFLYIFFYLNSHSQVRQIEIINSDQLAVDQNMPDVKKLIGNVALKHENAIMYCDSAYLFDADNKFEAFSHVRINQGDSMSLQSKHLIYEGNSKIAHTDGNVVLNQKNMTLYTDRLDYDMSSKIANYSQKAKIVTNENVLTSQNGNYNSNTKELFFKRNVVLVNPKYTMTTDTMKFNTISEIAYFYGPTYIVTKTRDSIYCENGWYDTKKDFAQFSKNASIVSGAQHLKSDSMTYNQVSGIGKGFKNIWFNDTTEKLTITGIYGEYYQKSKSSFVTGKAIAIQISDSDTIYTHADTLRYIGDTSYNNSKMILAYKHVKIFKIDIQSAADSMCYSFSDSIIRLYQNPILWNKQNQLTADTIYIYQKNNKPNYIELINKAFICSQEKGRHYNQIKGKKIYGYIEDNELNRVKVEINGESIYYVKEDSLHYTGINQISCKQMMIYFKDKQVSGIKFYTENKGTIYPVNGSNPSKLRLKGFNWQDNRRPKKPSDILID